MADYELLKPGATKMARGTEPYKTLLPRLGLKPDLTALSWLRQPAIYLRQSVIDVEYMTDTQAWQGMKASVPLTTAARARDCVAPHLARLPYERSLALLLNADFQLFGLAIIGQGDVQASVADLRTLVAVVATHPVTGVILAHNHPQDGEPKRPEASEADLRMTKAAAVLLHELQTTLYDHLILPSCWDTDQAPFWSARETRPDLFTIPPLLSLDCDCSL